jgi:hypothetical protein
MLSKKLPANYAKGDEIRTGWFFFALIRVISGQFLVFARATQFLPFGR